MATAVPRRDVKHKVAGTIRDAFSGRDALAATGLSSPAAAMQACRDMIELNLMRHMLNEKAFEDSPVVMYVLTPIGERLLRPSVASQRELWKIELGELSSRDQADSLVDVCRQMIQDIDIRDRLAGLRSIKSTFMGCEAVDWVCRHTAKQRRIDAVALLSEMLRCALIKAVDNVLEVEFSDSSALYQSLVAPVCMDDFDTQSSLPSGCVPGVTYGSFRKGARQVALLTVERSRRDPCSAAASHFRSLVHTNVARVLHVFPHERSFVVVSERGSASFLDAILGCQSWNEGIIAHALRQICLGLAALHEMGLVYGALSLHTLHLGEGSTLESMPTVKLSFCDAVHSVSSSTNAAGPVPNIKTLMATPPSTSLQFATPFAAPDAVMTQASDLFSVGAIMHLLLSGTFPSKVTLEEGVDMSQPAWDVVSEPAQILVKTLLRFDPKQRPSAAMVKMLPWFVETHSKAPQLEAAFSTLRSTVLSSNRVKTASRSGSLSASSSAVGTGGSLMSGSGTGVSGSVTSAGVGASEAGGRTAASGAVERRNSLLRRGESFQKERKANNVISPSSAELSSTKTSFLDSLTGRGGSSTADGGTSPQSLSPKSGPSIMDAQGSIYVLVLSRRPSVDTQMLQKITEPSRVLPGLMIMQGSGVAGDPTMEFRVVDLADVQSRSDPAGKLSWHPAFRGADVVMLMESICDALSDAHAREAVASCRAVFESTFFGPAPAPVPMVMALADLVAFRETLLKENVLGSTDVSSPEYQRRENRLIQSITDRFEHVNKRDLRPFRVVLLPSMGEPLSSAAPSSGSAQVGSAEAAPPPEGRRQFATRRINAASTLQDIGARYAALAPSALTEAGPESVRRAVSDAVRRMAGRGSLVTKDTLFRIDNELTAFRMTRSLPSDPLIVGKDVPRWLTSLSLWTGSAEEAKDLFDNLPMGLRMLQLDEVALTVAATSSLADCLALPSSKLKTLILHRAGLSRSAISKLAPSLSMSIMLTVLDVSYNPIGDDGMELLADAVVTNMSLRRLHARQTLVQAKGLSSWKAVFRLNHTLEVLDLAENTALGNAVAELQGLMNCLKENVFPALHQLHVSPPLGSEMRDEIFRLSARQARFHGDRERYAYLQSLPKSPGSFLDLSCCRLRHLPFDSVTTSFVHITRINISSNNFASFPKPIFTMPLLEELIAVRSHIVELAPALACLSSLRVLSLAGNSIRTVPTELFSKLIKLEYVDLRYNQITDIPESIESLKDLKCLYLQKNCLVRLPQGVFSLQNLTALRCEGNPMHLVLVQVYRQFAARSTTLDLTHRGISGLPPEVGMLQRVSELLLSHNNLNWLPPHLSQMQSLTALDISNNRFEHFPRSVGGVPLKVFKHDQNPLSLVRPQSLVSAPLHEVLAGAASHDALKKDIPLRRVRVAIIGDQGVGKTTVANLLSPAPRDLSSENVVEMRPWLVEGSEFSVWDFAGSSSRDTFSIFAIEYSIYVLCISLDSEVASVTNARLWLENLRAACPNSSVVIVGTHADVVSPAGAAVMSSKIRELVQLFGQVKGFVTSGVVGSGMSSPRGGQSDVEAKVLAVAKAQQRDGELVSVAFVELEEALKVLREIRRPPLITKKEYIKVAQEVGFSDEDEIDKALQKLHELGSLYSLPQPSQHVVLDLAWMSSFLALLSSSLVRMSATLREEWLTADHFKQIWSASGNPGLESSQAQADFLSLLCDLGIMCQMGEMYTVPMLLADERPSWLWRTVDFPSGGGGSEVPEEVRRVFSVSLVRFGWSARVFCKLASRVRPIRMWRNLILAELLTDEGKTKLLVECHTSHTGGGTFDVRARGPHWPEAIQEVSQVLQALFENFQLVERLSTRCNPCAETHQIARSEVNAALAQLRPYYVCPNGFCIRVETIDPTCDVSAYSHRVLKASDYEILSDFSAKGKDGSFFQVVPMRPDAELREAWARASLVHKNIVAATGIVVDSQTPFVMYKMMPLGALDKLLQDTSLQVEWKLILRIARDVCEALRFAHNASPPVVHGNLRASVVMLGSLDATAPLVAKVSGFAPSGASFHWTDDVYSFGNLLVELLTRDPVQATPPAWCPAPLSSLIRLCREERELRPTFRDLKAELEEMDASTSKLTVALMQSISEDHERAAIATPVMAEEGEVVRSGLEKVAAGPAIPAPEPLLDPGSSKRRHKKVKLKRKASRISRKRSTSSSGSGSFGEGTVKTVPPKSKVDRNATQFSAGSVESDASSASAPGSGTGTPTGHTPSASGASTPKAGLSARGSAAEEAASLLRKKAESFTLRFQQGAVRTSEDQSSSGPDSNEEEEEVDAKELDAGGHDKPKEQAVKGSAIRRRGYIDASESSSLSSSTDESEDEVAAAGGPCLACRMERNPHHCGAFLSSVGTTNCGRCQHPLDAHAALIKGQANKF